MGLSFPYVSYQNLSTLLDRTLKSKSIRQAKQIHGMLLTSGAINETSLPLDSKLVGLYACCGGTGYARLLFDRIPKPNIFALNWIISAMAFNGQYDLAIKYFKMVYLLGMVPNQHTLLAILKVCVGLLDLNKGREVHSAANRMGMGCHVLMCNALVDMYSKCGKLDHARKLFDMMGRTRDVVSWTTIISGYCNMGKLEESMDLFERMRFEGVLPNEFTWNAVISGHAQSGDCDAALQLIHMMDVEGIVPDLVTWNALISGFALRKDQASKAVELFKDMLSTGIRPNSVTITGLLPACELLGSIQRVKEIHTVIYRLGVEMNVYVAGALIDMYAKCGSVTYSKILFDQTPVKNTVIYNSMIGCYAKHGFAKLAVKLFDEMQEQGTDQANEVTLASVLSACSHGGCVEKGIEIFESMKSKFGVAPNKEHYACVVDLLCRVGKIEEAYELVVRELPAIENATDSILGAFLNGCKIHGRTDLAKRVIDDQLNIEKPQGFTLISNIYADSGDFTEVDNLRQVMKSKGVRKRPGFSLVERRGDYD